MGKSAQNRKYCSFVSCASTARMDLKIFYCFAVSSCSPAKPVEVGIIHIVQIPISVISGRYMKFFS